MPFLHNSPSSPPSSTSLEFWFDKIVAAVVARRVFVILFF